MDWYDLKIFLETTILIIGLVGNFAFINVYINEKNDRKDMKEISSSKVVGKYSYIEKTSEEQIKYKVVLENGKELNVSQDIWNRAEIQK